MKFIHLIRCNIPLVASKQLWRTMRIFMVIMTAFLMQVSASTSAQQVTLKSNNISLKQVFTQIRKQTGYVVLIELDLLNKAKSLNVDLRNASLEEAMNSVLEGQNLKYLINNKSIIVSEKQKSLIDRVVDYFQQINVTGKIVDENGQAIAGATIKVKGTALVAISDGEGVFALRNVEENAVLEISYVGYQTKEVKALKDLGNVKMEVAVGKLDEVSVNAGYYTVKQRELTGNISRITSKDIETQPVTNILATMQGRMAGVNIVQSTGTPGGGFDIKIRGQNSLRDNANAPLYIIDGVPYASDALGSGQTSSIFPFPTSVSPINNINPNNIESIEVLKDADATAIYGSRGANGVVLITTMKGKSGKTKFDFNSATGFGKVTRFFDLLNTTEYLAIRKKAFANDGIANYPATAYDVNGTWDQNRYTDWQKEILGGTARTNDFRGTISGGTANTQFLFNGNYRNESTVLPGDFIYLKGGGQLSLNHRSTDHKFLLSASAGYNIQDNDQPAADLASSVRYLQPNAPALYKADGSLNWENSTWENPLRNLNAKYRAKTGDLVTNAVLSYKLLDNVTFKSSFGYTNLSHTDSRTAPSTVFNPALNLTSQRSGIFTNDTKRSSWIIEPQVNWEKDFTNSKLSILVGSTFQSQTTSKLYLSGSGFPSNDLIYNVAAATNKNVSLNEETIYKYQAFFGRINYNWKERYIVNLTARRDGSSRFGPGDQFGNFGAIGAAWLFSEENFLKNQSWLSFGKLRGSYGITGNDQIGDYQFLNTYNTSGAIYNATTGLQPSRLFNPNFGWEMNKKLELAIELGLFKDRISASAAWYQNRSSNQLVGIPLPGTTGFTTLQANLNATVENSGLEFTLNTVNLQTQKFKWNTNFNLSFAKNKLLSFPNLASSTYSQRYRVGYPLNINLLYKLKGVNTQTGIYEFEDLNNNGIISSPDDRQVIVDLTPKYFGGIQNQLSYGRFNLDFLFQFVKQTNRTYPMSTVGAMVNVQRRFTNGWLQAGDTAPYQIYTSGTNSKAVTANSFYGLSDATVTDASFIRLKNIAFSYELPELIKEVKGRVMLQGQNMLTFTKYEDGDPEFTTYGYLPPLKIITAGIQLTF